MPPKRRRSSDPATSNSRATAAAVTSPASVAAPSSPYYWGAIVLEWRAISKNKQRCTDLMQALVESKVLLLPPSAAAADQDQYDSIAMATHVISGSVMAAAASSSTPTEEHADCYWLLLATHAMNRMVGVLEPLVHQQQGAAATKKMLPLASLLAHLCHAVASSLLGDKHGKSAKVLLDRLTHKPVRSMVGRAMVSLTVASTVALQILSSLASEEQVDGQSLWCALLSLDTVIHQSPNNNSSNKTTLDGWHRAVAALTHVASKDDADFQSLFEAADKLLKPTAEERTCLAALFEGAPKELTPVAAKRQRRPKKQSAAAEIATAATTPLGTCFAKNILQHNNVNTAAFLLDGRMNMRRWPSMAFCWLCQGQERILQAGHDLLLQACQDDATIFERLECPTATVSTTTTPTPAATSPKRGKKTKAAPVATSTTTTTTFVAIPGNVALVTFLTRIFSIVAESSSHGGTRPPTGGMDAYAQNILSSGKRKAPTPIYSKYKKPNICNLIVATVYGVLQLHQVCLQEHCKISADDDDDESKKTSAHSKRMLLVNDDDCAIVDGVTRYCPHLVRKIESMCRNASDAADSIRKLLTLASCHTLQQVAHTDAEGVVVMDAKLCRMAVGQFHFCFSFLINYNEGGPSSVNDENGSDASATALLQSCQSLDPLPAPALAMSKQSAKGRGKRRPAAPTTESMDEDMSCTFAGVLAPTQLPVGEVPVDERLEHTLLPLFFRAIVPNENHKTSPGAIVTMLLDMLECCYNTIDYSSTKPATAGARASKSKSTKGKKKKMAPIAPSAEKVVDQDAPPRLRRLNGIRAGLASDVCNVLRCLTTQHALHSYFRSCIATDQLCRFVRLAHVLETILTTTSTKDANSASAKKNVATTFFNPSSSDYNLYERTLWSSHTNLCCTLGRGTLLYSSKKTTKPILGDAETRLAVFKEIPKVYGTKEWPLHLAASHHALVSSNLTSEPFDGEDAAKTAPEEFVANSMIRSISEALEDPSIVTYAKWLGNALNGDNEGTIDERVPLSIRDGRLLLVTISRLSTKSQLKHVTKLANSMAQSFSAYQKDVDIVFEHVEVSQFLARVVTVYASLLNLVTVDLRDALLAQVGPIQYALPQLYTLGGIHKGCLAKDGNWYKRESSFMGLYADWESPVLPTSQIKEALPKDLLSKTNQIFEHALSVGFECAGNDFGQLLFSSWNATGRKLTWDVQSLRESSINPFDASKSLPILFLELREDICYVYHFVIAGTRESLPESLAGQILKSTRLRQRTVKETLEKMLEKARLAIDFLVDKADGDDDGLGATALALLEGLPVYIAFIMAMHTSTSDNLFTKGASKKKSKSRKRRRLITSGSGYDIELLASIMSDEDSVGSEDDYDDQDGEDGMIDALARLHDACNSFGAAPMHPDWLDSTCSFQVGISAERAGHNAAKAIECLTKVGVLANTQHTIAVTNCMAVLAGKNIGDKSSDTAASLCCMAVDFSNGMLEEGEDEKETDFQKALASVFEIPHVAIQDFYNDSASTGWRAAKEAWIPNCPQRIVGVLQSQSIDGIESTSSEYRAGGEWEMMISEALVGACTGCGMEDSDYTIWKSFEVSPGKSDDKARRVFDAYTREERWLRISQGLVAQLMPATALLRFSAASGTGRDTHPLSVRESEKDSESLTFTSSADELKQFTKPSFSVTTGLKDALTTCVALLARQSARCNGDSGPKLSCTAVAANLLLEIQPFEEIEGIESLCMAFEALESLQIAASTKKSLGKDRMASFRLISDLLVSMIKVRGNSPELSKLYSTDSAVIRLMTALGAGTRFEASILGITHFDKDALVSDGAMLSGALKSLTFVLCSDDSHIDTPSRARVASMLGEVVQLEGQMNSESKSPNMIRTALLKTLNSLDASRLKTLIVLAYPENTGNQEIDRQAADVAKGMSKILACVMSSGSDTAPSVKFCKKTFNQLKIRFDRVSTVATSRESSLGVLFLFACLVGSLDSVGSTIVAKLDVEGSDESDLVTMECFVTFVQGLRMNLTADVMSIDKPEYISKQGTTPPASEVVVADLSDVSNTKTPRACSHVLRNGFFQQHWYNCYTCGLVFDKGCCTLCALTCHRGHEVAYSRYSSFFCDCGAEVSSAGEQNRVVCKCITLMPAEEAKKIFQEEKDTNHWRTMPEVRCPVDTAAAACKTTQASRAIDLYVDIAKTYTTEASSAVEKIKVEASQSAWVNKVFGAAKSKSTSNIGIINDGVDLVPFYLTRDSVASSLAARCSTPCVLEPLEHLDLVPVRAARAGTFNLKMSIDSTTDRLKRAMLSRHGIVRSAVLADSRGRLIVAEPCSLVFCSILPAVNVRFVDDALSNQIGRSQMSVISSHAVPFNIVGMQLCSENERHVVVWGTSEACVVVLRNRWDGVEKTFTLEFDLDPHDCESDYLIRCDWLPGSQTRVSVACGSFVKIYDISSSESDDNVPSVLSYSIAYEATVKDIAWVSFPFASGGKKLDSSKRCLKVFFLMDTGRLQEIQLQVDSKGEIVGQGTSYLDRSTGCVDIPIAGVRSYEGMQPGMSGASTRSLGEGCSLCFLPQSALLLYKCVSSCVIAICFGKMGETQGSFELLPNRVESHVYGKESDSSSITGPFTHWTEMGISNEGFRLVCVGKSSRTSQPKLLCVDINEKAVKVKEITWSVGGSVGLGLSLSSSFEGLIPFSAPVQSPSEGFIERICLCAITSNGSVLIYGKETDKEGGSECISSDCAKDADVQSKHQKPRMALTLYEDLLNVSEVSELKFAGDGKGSASDSIKAKLSTKNSVYLMSPSRDGCTITVSLEGDVEMAKLTDVEGTTDRLREKLASKDENHREELVIVALRLLVGSTTTDCLPSRVFVQGRPIALTPDLKRWYDLPLTLEEVVIALRSGFVSIGLGPTFEVGNNPLIDAVEVYAIERKKIQHLIPTSLQMETTFFPSRDLSEENDGATRALILTTRVLSSLYQLVDATLDENTPEGRALKELIRSTALKKDISVRESVIGLLESLESDYDIRQKFLDKGTILGMSEALQSAAALFRTTDPDELEAPNLCRKVKSLIERSLNLATSIALSRPDNYVSAIGQLASEGLKATSIALDSSEILLSTIRLGILHRDILENVVHIVLAELSISKSQTDSVNGEFATFAIISQLLRSENEEIVERCCEAIISFVSRHSTTGINPVAGIFNPSSVDQIEPSAPIAYQCDSCSKFPITDTRYTILEDDYDIDLCTRCYQLGGVYAELHDFSPNSPMIINGRSIGGDTQLNCAQIRKMQSVPIVNGTAIVEQVEQALQEAKSAGNANVEDPLRRAIRFSQTEKANASDRITINFDKFTDGLFDNILGHVGSILDGGSTMPIGSVNPLLTLLLDSITMGANEKAHISRGKRYARECMKHVRRILGYMRLNPRSQKPRYILLINFLRSVSRLTGAADEDFGGFVDDCSEAGTPSPGKSKGKTDPRFVCNAHDVPAVRRRVSQGANKNRRFYVCGMERKHRCKYFQWADEESKPARSEREPPTQLEMNLQPYMWQLISDTSEAKSASLSDQLCDLLEVELAKSEANRGKAVRPLDVKSSSEQAKEATKVALNSIYDIDSAVVDLNDGAFCSKEKVQGFAPVWLCKQESRSSPKELLLPGEQLDDQTLADKFIEASLDLVSTVASASSNVETKVTGQTRWFSLLCEVISMSPASRFRAQAKRALKRMCDGNRAQYHSVRDHYVFGFQFKEIFHHGYPSLDGALCVREQARQCGDMWKEDEVSWQGLAAGELLGCLDSISEDSMTVANSKQIGSILDDIMLVTKSRGGNWRNFCSFLQLPASNRQRSNVTLVDQERATVERLFGGPPIISLFWLCCSISGINQIKVMKLLDVALTSAQDRRRQVASPGKESAEFVDNGEGMHSDAAMEVESEEHSQSVNAAPQQIPEATLVNAEKGLSVENIYAFALEFVLRGRTAELRRISSQVAIKICRSLTSEYLATLFYLLVDKPLAEIESLGCCSVQFLQLLQSLVKIGQSNENLELTNVAHKIAQGFAAQMNLFKLIGGKAQFELEAGRENSLNPMKRFDMGSCVYCHGKNSQPREKKSSTKDPKSRTKTGVKEPNTESVKLAGPQWLPDQVRPFTRGRLEASTDNTCSSEFASFVQLKCRLSISDIHLTANDPRGRYAKSIVVFFTPRQVSEVSQLKSADYEHLWQECGKISLGRCTTRASCTLPIPVTAANLKFEYRDFYDRAGESGASDGSFVLFCPRCSRQVNNAHGVCGSCGECVFQCRRCRHIQYDRPDAFLCTECGHCSSGSFSYELTAGVASNAVAIVDDESHKRTVRVSRVATKLHGELQTALVERVRANTSRKRSHSEDDPLAEYSPAMKRALMGDLPLLSELTAETAPTNVRGGPSSASRGVEGRSSAANRARSLLRLARQLRNDGGDRATRREMLVREAFLGSSREFLFEDVEEEGTDIVGLFGNSDRDDPLTRLVASISGRRTEERATSGGNPSNSTNANTVSNKKESIKSSLQECEKLSHLMREAERECHELQRRLNAWWRLEHDSLPESHLDTDESFSPTMCSRCAGPITLHLLLLILRIFQSSKITEAKTVITKEFIRALFVEPAQMHKDLVDLKRLAITTFCTKSDHAAKLILDELRARLRASGDATSASILGKLLVHDFALADQFVELATETLESNFLF